MSAATLRVLDDDAAPPAWNMAVDEALLASTVPATLRLYRWWPHAVSLGWFQRAEDFADVPAGTPIVRRPTGGGAIHHCDELTFALALDAALLPRDVAASYRLVHGAAIRALATIGVDCVLADGPSCSARARERWCFREPGRDDVVTAGGKLMGSAQRRVARPRARVLHHGSLVLTAPALTPFAAAVGDHRTVDDATRTRLAAAFVRELAHALALVPVRGALHDGERELAARLAAERHADCALLRSR